MDWRSVGLASLYGALAVLTPDESFAQLAYPGYSGLISTPNADVLAEGQLAFSFCWMDGQHTYLFAPKINRMYVVTVGILPGVEATLRQTQVIGWQDPAAPGVQHAFDRMVSTKYTFPMPEGSPKLAVGVQDLASANFLTGITGAKPGVTQYGQSTLYGVVGDKYNFWTWHGGLGISQAFINGPFAGISLHPSETFSLLGEWDSHGFNFGSRYSPIRGWQFQISLINQTTVAFSCEANFYL